MFQVPQNVERMESNLLQCHCMDGLGKSADVQSQVSEVFAIQVKTVID